MRISSKTFFTISGIIFLIIGVLQLTRAVMRWPATINNFSLPVWLSYVLAIIALFLAYSGFRLMGKAK